jgi:hypothetical protein
MKTLIQTVSGIIIDPLNPDPNKINIHDIAYALSHICRFTGHTRRFYSVAEHSIRLFRAINSWYAPVTTQFVPILSWALLHDAPEAYVADLASPLKHNSVLGENYRPIEENLKRTIAYKFNLPLPEPPIIKAWDQLMLRAEQKLLMAPRRKDEDPEFFNDLNTYEFEIEHICSLFRSNPMRQPSFKETREEFIDLACKLNLLGENQ